MEAVTLTNISKRYGSVEALRGVSLSVAPGELFGIIGPDGAGKTSLFRILTTLLLADGGSASVCGLDVVKDYKAIRRRVGYMPGRFSLYPDLTVEENLNFFATVFHTTIEENYDLVRDIYRQIEPFRKRRAGALSGGMKQKLALSCALIHKPDVLFLDEPTTGVDPVSRKEFWGMLRRLKEQGITIIASTPIIDEARQCDRIAFINEGEIKGIDTPDRILTRFAGILCPPGLQHERVENHENKVIEVEGLTKRFGNFTAVDHISFQVHRGEIFGFLGANGAGKTTAMRMLTGLSRPTGGKACVAGFDVASQPEEVKKNIGYMSQKFSLYEDLKVWENIRLFAGIYGIPEAEIAPKTEELLLRLGLEKERDTLVKSLPLGWKQKLAFSVSIFHRPKIVFLDEPTGGVDPATRRQFWELIYQAADEGITVFVIGHVNKEGSIAGPKVLEHMVDCVLYFEGEAHMSYRILRAAKNRFGATNEIGVFEMRSEGLVEVPNPSEMLLSGRPDDAPGTCVTCVMEGQRPVLAEVQALLAPAAQSVSRRTSNGFDYNRAAMLMAVLEKRGALKVSGCDAFLNVIGGLSVDEPAADLAAVLALASSYLDKPIGNHVAAIGEVGLTGELRSVNHLSERLSEVHRLGFETCIIPKQRKDQIRAPQGLALIEACNIAEALRAIVQA